MTRNNYLTYLRETLIILALLLLIGRFVTQTHARMLTNSNSALGDQRAFLQLGLDLREQGILTDGTRNPLYAAALATFASRTWSYFTWAKLLNVALGVLAILTVYALGRRFFNAFTGLVAAYLLSINVEFIVHSATALAEPLLVLTFVLAWFAMLAALSHRERPGLWALAGVLTGLAYLTKGSAQILAIAFVLVALLIHRRQLFKGHSLWLFLGCYVLTAAPLWLYNTVTFGSPTFNYAITHQMWMDSWREWHPDDTAHLPTAASYLQTHTPAEILQRQWDGMKALRNIFVQTLYPTRTLRVDQFLLSPVSGWTLALLALLPLLFWPATRRYLRDRGPAVYLTLLVTAAFFLLFAWYVSIVALGHRFLLPLIPFIFLLAADIVGRLGRHLANRGRGWRWAVWGLLALVVALQLRWAIRAGLEPAQQFLSTSVFARDEQFFAQSVAPLAWLANHSPQVETVAWGPPAESLPTWASSDRLDFLLYPPRAATLADLTANLVSRGTEFIIVAPEMVSRYESLLAEAFPSNGAQIEPAVIPPGWALAFADRGMPCEWCVFRLLDTAPPGHAVDYRLGDAIQLAGYDLPPTSFKPGDPVPLTLHWTALAAPASDLTVFTQLLGPDWQLHGQQDNQPVNNHWPTSRWQPGDHIADRYPLTLDPAAPPGQYHLLVGMYNAQTGQRVPVTHQGQPLPDNAIFLTTLTVE